MSVSIEIKQLDIHLGHEQYCIGHEESQRIHIENTSTA